MRNSKDIGEFAEAKFVVKAIEEGLIVSEPTGDSAPYDRIVDNGNSLYRIQVKSTSKMQVRSNGSRKYKILAARTATTKTAYTRKMVDFFACYVEPEDLWYVVPLASVGGAITINLYPHVQHSTGKYEEYKEAWHLLKEKSNGQN